MSQLTAEIKAELNGKLTEDRREALTVLHQQGYNIRSYLEEMLVGLDGIHCSLKDKGFKSVYFTSDKLWLYTLGDKKTTFFYQELPDKTYKPWP